MHVIILTGVEDKYIHTHTTDTCNDTSMWSKREYSPIKALGEYNMG